MLGLHFCARAFSSCSKRWPLFIAVRGHLTIMASLVAEHRLQAHRLSSCGSRAQLLHGMWDLPRPGLEPVSPALAGRFSTTVPPGKPIFLLEWALVVCVFQGISPFLLNCQLYWHKVVHNIPLLFFIKFLKFILFLLNERFFKFYRALQFSKVSHAWFHIIPLIILQDLLILLWCHLATWKLGLPLGGCRANEHNQAKIRRRKDLLLLAASKESTRDPSQSSVYPNSKKLGMS